MRLDLYKPATLLRRIPSGPFSRDVSAALHPTEPWVAVRSYHSRMLQVYNYQSGAVLKTLELDNNSGDVVWHPQGHTLAVSEGDGTNIWLYDCTTWKQSRTLHCNGPCNVLAFNPAGDRLASVAWTGRVYLFDVSTGKLLVETPPISISMLRLRFSRDGRRLARTSEGRQIGIWEVGDARECRTLLYQGLGRFGEPVAVWTDNRLLATPIDPHIQFWDLESGLEIGELPTDRPARFQFVPGTPKTPGALITDTANGVVRWPIERAQNSPGTLRIGPSKLQSRIHAYWTDHSSDGRFVAGASRTIGQYQQDAGGWILPADRPGPPIRRLEEGRDILFVALSLNGDLAATSPHLTGVNRVWDVPSGRLLKELGTTSGTYPRFSPDGKWLAVSGATGALYAVGTWEEPLGFNGLAQFSPNSQLLAVRTKSGRVRLIDIRRGDDLAWFESPNQATGSVHIFTPDGTRLITVSRGKDGGILVWDLRAIRRQLKAMGLDWEAPDYPPEPTVPMPWVRSKYITVRRIPEATEHCDYSRREQCPSSELSLFDHAFLRRSRCDRSLPVAILRPFATSSPKDRAQPWCRPRTRSTRWHADRDFVLQATGDGQVSAVCKACTRALDILEDGRLVSLVPLSGCSLVALLCGDEYASRYSVRRQERQALRVRPVLHASTAGDAEIALRGWYNRCWLKCPGRAANGSAVDSR